MALGRCAFSLAFAVAVGSVDASGEVLDSCPRPAQRRMAGESLLLQVHTKAEVQRTGVVQKSFGITSDCARRLNAWGKSNAACLLTRGDTTLMVYVPYGGRPGWDFPGGMRHHGEHACETAERETCEETGYQVRALAQLSSSVFRCEIVASNVCRKPVDEGFLRKRWFPKQQLGQVRYRGGTWGGNKKGLIEQSLADAPGNAGGSPSPPTNPSSEKLDVCGCKMCRSEGFSTRAQTCARGSNSERNEACACVKQRQRPEGVDSCGCRPCRGEGYSTTRGRCAQGSDTDAREACSCANRVQA